MRQPITPASAKATIPCYKPNGKTLFFNRLELDRWLLRNRKATNKEIEAKAETFVTVNNPVAV
jgi:hypothetical protein